MVRACITYVWNYCTSLPVELPWKQLEKIEKRIAKKFSAAGQRPVSRYDTT